MTERERLIELLKESEKKVSEIFSEPLEIEEWLGVYADYLLANGVTVLPCKVGDTIYRCGDPIKKVYEWEIEHIELYLDAIVFVDDSDNEFTAEDIGKTAFLSKEEAEKALERDGK